jgi:hypothetical protein
MTSRELELAAATAPPSRDPGRPWPPGEAVAMLARRGFKPTPASLDLPFPPDLDGERVARLVDRLRHYGFRLFLRGAIQRPDGFSPAQATRYLTPAQSKAHAESLVDLGLGERLPPGGYRLVRPARSFGGTLEWYVARELRERLGFDAAAGLKFHARGVGGDLDVVAAAEGKLAYLELKSSPPKHLSTAELSAFLDRVEALRPHVSLFVMDTALRLSDKVVPMLQQELARRRPHTRLEPRRVERELWALTPHLYAVNAKPDLMANIGRALAEGLFALAP